MKLTRRAILLAVAALLAGIFSQPVFAAACTSAASGNWSAAATWAAPCNVAGGPVAGDTVTIAAAHTVTVDVNSAATSISVTAPSGATNGVTLSSGVTLSVSGAVSMAAPTVNGRTSTFAVGSGTLNAGSILINGGGAATRISQMTVSTGTVNVTGAVTSGGTAAQSRFISSGASNVIVGGSFSPGAFTPNASTVTVSGNFTPTTMAAGGTGTVIFTGGAGQNIGAYATYNNITINKTTGTTANFLGATTIGGTLTVSSGTLSIGAFALTVTGPTSISSTFNITSATGAKTFNGAVTINPGGVWNNSNNAAIILHNGLTHDGATFTAGTGIYTFNTNAQAIGGSSPLSIPRVTVTGVTLTNTGTLTVATALAGTGGLTNTTTLNIGGASTITTLTANAVGNTVNYTGAAQTVKPTAYHHLGLGGSGNKILNNVSAINGNLTLSGTATATTAIGLTIGGNLDIGAGTVFTAAGFNLTVTGATSISGTHGHSSATGTKIYTGLVTIQPGGTWTNASNSAITLRGGLVHNGATFTAGTGIYTFDTNSQTIGGTNAIAIPRITVTGVTLTNNGTLTAATALAGSGGLTNGTGAALTLGGTSAITTLTASAAPNTVNYNGSAQTINGTTYHHLTLAGGGANPLGGNTTVDGALTLTSGTLSVGANTLTLNGPAIAGAGAATNLTTTAASNITFGGSAAAVTLPGSVTALNNLTVNNSNGINLGGSAVTTTLNGTLALGANNLTTGTNTLALAGNCTANSGNGSLTRSSGYVIGNLKLTFPAGSSTCTYHVGDSIGYAPITLTMAVTGTGTLSGRVDANDHPDTLASASGIDATKSANHYWTLTAGTVAFTSYSATLQFCANTGACVIPTEVDSGANTGNFVVALKSSGIWSTQTVGIKNAYSTQATSITALGEFAVGEVSTNNCFTDSFTGVDGASPGPNWSVGSKSGAFGNPVIFGNRLRLTNATVSDATWATLQRLIPAASNKVTVTFDYFAYGGTHADGIGVILSNAAVAPQAGAFGGSLGYAQKSNPGSDCTVPGGCPGFAGGWLGIGLDEFGNYSNPTEGRNGGTGQVVNSVAVRGSGTGLSGYRFLQGTGTLSPAVDAVSATPHRYRIVVDHSDGIHAWTSVERDTTGGGTAYTTLIGCPPGVTTGCTPLDVSNPGNSQNPVPTNFDLSFTGSTGDFTNVHEIDNLSVCTVQGLATPTLHHIKIEHGGSACTNSPATITVKACADAACSSLYMGNVTVDLTPNAGGGRTWAPAEPVTFSGGSVVMTLTNTTANTQTLGGTATSPTTPNATQCFNGATQTCTLVFSACTVDAVETSPTSVAGTPIFTKLAGTTFTLDAVRTGGGNQNVSLVELVDASSGTCGTYPPLSLATTTPPSTISPTTFTLSGATPRQTVTFTYNNAAPNVRVRMTTPGPVLSCSNDNFAIRPASFTLTSSATQSGSSGTPVFRAGTDPFSLTATAVYGATTTPGYTGTPALNSGLIYSAQANPGVLTNPAIQAAVAGVSTSNGFKYSEVGNIYFGQPDPLKPDYGQPAIYDYTFAKVDADKGECTSGFNNVLDGNGKYSCQFGSTLPGSFGRFVPDHFTVMSNITNACPGGNFTYMDQPFTLSTTNVVEARNFADGRTQNYTGAYAPGIPAFAAENADNGTDLSARITLPSGSAWGSGVDSGRFLLPSVNLTFNRLAAGPDGPFESLDIGLTVNDSDVSTVPIVAGADMNPSVPGGTVFTHRRLAGSPLRMRYGILKLDNAFSSELLNIRVPVRAMFLQAAPTQFVVNTADSCTTIAPANIAIGNWLGPALSNANFNNTHRPTGNLVLSGGVGTLVFAKPSPTAIGSADIALNLGATGADTNCIGASYPQATTGANLPWLRGNWCNTGFTRDPSARVTFGTAKNPFIYLREKY
ncbi:MAG: hypothetical protein HY066_02425 [Betaproteobacteria bacterium]|nr:hypothetical protein [Betaproteobacteria bacterium]